MEFEALQQKIDTRKAAEHAADEALKLIEELLPESSQEIYWRRIAESAQAHLPAQPAPVVAPSAPAVEPMSDNQAELFRRSQIPRGNYEGQRVGSVPLSCLDWWAHRTDPFTESLNRYLANPGVAADLKQELIEDA
jgi:hypothetical protein